MIELGGNPEKRAVELPMCDIVLMHELKALPIKVSMHAMQILESVCLLGRIGVELR